MKNKKKPVIIIIVVLLAIVVLATVAIVVYPKIYPEFRNSEKDNYIPQNYIALFNNGWEDSDCFHTYLYINSKGKASYITTYEPVNVMGSYGNTRIIKRKNLNTPEDILKEKICYKGYTIELEKAIITTNIDFRIYKKGDIIPESALDSLMEAK